MTALEQEVAPILAYSQAAQTGFAQFEHSREVFDYIFSDVEKITSIRMEPRPAAVALEIAARAIEYSRAVVMDAATRDDKVESLIKEPCPYELRTDDKFDEKSPHSIVAVAVYARIMPLEKYARHRPWADYCISPTVAKEEYPAHQLENEGYLKARYAVRLSCPLPAVKIKWCVRHPREAPSHTIWTLLMTHSLLTHDLRFTFEERHP